MSNFYIINYLNKDEQASKLKGTTYDADLSEIDSIFYKGVSLKGQVKEPLSVILDDRLSVIKKPLMDRMYLGSNAGIVWLISPRAKEILERLDLPVEFIEVNIKGQKVNLGGYFIVNVIGRINCVDWEKSNLKFNKRLNYIKRYYSLTLDEGKIPLGTNIFLLGEDITAKIIVSESVKLAIEEAALTGFVFVIPEEYSTFSK